ncbi:MAG: T9SS type A sorting domain-containing protein [Bacteroidia bacterium]
MKKYLLITFFCLTSLVSQSQNYWAKTIQFPYENYECYPPKSFVDSSGNFYALNHLMTQPSYVDTFVSVSKFNSIGNLIWSYLYVPSFPEIKYTFLVQGKDGLPVILIYYTDYHSNSLIDLFKLDTMGNVINTKTYHIRKAILLSGIISTSDSGFLAFGDIPKNGFRATYILKLDSLFNINWTYRQKVDSNSSYGFCAFETPANYFIGGAYSRTKYVYGERAYILKLKKNGHAVKAKVITNEDWSICQGITRINNNHLIALSSSSISERTILTEFDDSLNVISQKETNPNHVFNLAASTDSLIYMNYSDITTWPGIVRVAIFDKFLNFLLGMQGPLNYPNEIIPGKGSSFYLRPTQDFQNNFDVLKVDTSINNSSCISKFYQIDLFPSVINIYDTLVPTPQFSFQPSDTVINITKLPETLTITDLCLNLSIVENTSETYNLFPNPFNDELNLTIQKNEPSEIILYDITSRTLLQQTFTTSTTLSTSQLAKGIYIYEVRNNSGVIKKGKVVKD